MKEFLEVARRTYNFDYLGYNRAKRLRETVDAWRLRVATPEEEFDTFLHLSHSPTSPEEDDTIYLDWLELLKRGV